MGSSVDSDESGSVLTRQVIVNSAAPAAKVAQGLMCDFEMCWFLVALCLVIAFVLGWLLGSLKRESSCGPEPQHKVKKRPWAGPREEVGCEVLDEAGQEFYYLSRYGTKVHYSDQCPGLNSADPRLLMRRTLCKLCQERGVEEKKRKPRSPTSESEFVSWKRK